MRKLLYITPHLPESPLDHGSKIRDYHILKKLSERFEITLVGVIDLIGKKEVRLESLPVVKTYSVELHPLNYATLFKDPYLPHWALNYNSEKMYALLEDIERKEKFDVVHISHGYIAPYVKLFLKNHNTLKVLDHHNVKTELFRRAYSHTKNFFKKIDYKGEYIKWEKFQKKYFGHFDVNLATSDKDAEFLRPFLGGKPIKVIPSGVNDSYIIKKKWQTRPPVILFTGSLDYFANEEAVLFFCKRCLPLIKKEVPDVLFRIVGRAPTSGLIKYFQNTANLDYKFDVMDVRPYYYQARCKVVPLLNGSGTRLKILESLSAGIPVVSTSKGAEGLDLKSGEEILIADNPQLFSESVVKLLKDDDMALRLSEMGYLKTMSRYKWEKTLAGLEDVYKQ